MNRPVRSIFRLRVLLAPLFVLCLCVVLDARPGQASELSDDLGAKRARVMDRLGRDAMLILWSAPVQRYSLDIDYEYRQDSNLYYLTGLTQEGTILVLMPGNMSHQAILFIKDKDPVQEHWHGRTLTPDEARARSGIETVLTTAQFEPFVEAILGRHGYGPVAASELTSFFDALSANRARLAILGEEGRGADEPPAVRFAGRMRGRFGGFDTINPSAIFDDLRTVKTPYERKVLVKSLEISNEAQLAGMRAARPGAYEYEVKAAIEAVHRGRGAVSWSYPSIVGSGPNATTLHYPGGDRQMRAGELLLVDAACNYDYMSGDITRTYPVNGKFSPLQKDIYRVVLQAQEEGIRAASKPGATLQDVHAKTVEVIKAGLLALGLIVDPRGEEYKLWYTHGASHYIGIDVHDVGSRTRALEPGMAFTIEPGIYIRQSALDALPRTPENLAFVERVQPAVRKYADIGVRVEDSFLVEATGLRTLSSAVPKTIEAIEAFLARTPDSKGRP
jgi:Xaa-Pro aminopeptidase